MKPKLSSTVSVIKLNNNYIEFFKTNTRDSIKIKVQNDDIFNLVNSLDGTKTIDEICLDKSVKKTDLESLISFLAAKGILSSLEPTNDIEEYEKYRRVIAFLNDYASDHEVLKTLWKNVTKACILIVGVGAVGSWVTTNLVQSGVRNLILMDNDVVDISNLHRQCGFLENDIGKSKVKVIKEHLEEFNKNLNIECISDCLNEISLNQFNNKKIDLIINCADKPTVDQTSLWIGEYGMRRNIPHIIGGGYNMHLSLMGQSVIPGKTACVKCFEKQLEEENRIDTTKIKKLAIKNRKVGSFVGMCSIIASMIGMEAIKIISKCTEPSNVNRRGELDIYSMNIKYKSYYKRDDCEWCGKDGIYFNK